MASNICDKIAQFGRGKHFPLQNLKMLLFAGRNDAVLTKIHFHQPTLNPRMLQIRECFKENVATSAFHCCNKSLEHNQLQKRRCFVGSIFWRFMLTFCWPHCFRVREEAMHQGWMCGRGSLSLQLESNREKWLCVQFWLVVFPQWSQFLVMGPTFLMISHLLIATQNMDQVFQPWLIVGHQIYNISTSH